MRTRLQDNECRVRLYSIAMFIMEVHSAINFDKLDVVIAILFSHVVNNLIPSVQKLFTVATLWHEEVDHDVLASLVSLINDLLKMIT